MSQLDRSKNLTSSAKNNIAMNCNRALNLTEYGLITHGTSAQFKTINLNDVQYIAKEG